MKMTAKVDMKEHLLVPREKVDEAIDLNIQKFNKVSESYLFEGNTSNKPNFNRLLAFEDLTLVNQIFGLGELQRLVNSYYWYTAYIVGLEEQGISTTDLKQVRFRIIESIGNIEADFNWQILEDIEAEVINKKA